MTSKPRSPTNRILLGEITSAHGIRGDVLVRTHTAEPDGIDDYGPLQTEDGRRTVVLSIRRVTDKGVIASVAGVTDRNGAEALRGTKLYVDRSALPEPEAGSYYHSDLVGLGVHGADGAELGEVVAIVNYGAGDLVEIRMHGAKGTELIPLIESYVPEIDIAARCMTVIMPETVGNQDEENAGEA